jgi:diphosphomevalonate decarboxylase
MHASALAADPPVLYWNPTTMGAMQAVQAARRSGLHAYFTMDAGPHVKVLCHARDAAAVERLLGAVEGVRSTVVAAPGPGAALLDQIEEG